MHMTLASTNVADIFAPATPLLVSTPFRPMTNKFLASWSWLNYIEIYIEFMYGTTGENFANGDAALISTPFLRRLHGPRGPTTMGSTNVT